MGRLSRRRRRWGWWGVALAACQPRPPAGALAPVKVAVEGTYPPFSFVGENGRLEGFEVDLARLACAAMEVECALVATPFEALLPGLVGGRYSMAFASLEPTAQRRTRVHFTRPYLAVDSAVVAASTSTRTGPQPAAEVVVGVQRGTTHESHLRREGVGRIRRYNSYPEAALDLRYGRIDLFFGDGASVARLVAASAMQPEPLQRVDGIGWQGHLRQQIAAAVSFRHAAWLPRLDDALRRVVDSGEHARLVARYFAHGGVGAPP